MVLGRTPTEAELKEADAYNEKRSILRGLFEDFFGSLSAAFKKPSQQDRVEFDNLLLETYPDLADDYQVTEILDTNFAHKKINNTFL